MSVSKLLLLFGINTKIAKRAFCGLPIYLRELRILNSQLNKTNNDFSITRKKPCFQDRNSEGGTANGHYFHQDLLVAQQVFKNNPIKHLDIGSRIDGLVAHIASFRCIDVMDIRPLRNTIPNICFIQADLMMPISASLYDAFDSISCLHALEHFGLGRYGDPIKHDGHLIGLENIARMLKMDGKFYFSTPIGPQRIEFNAHRVFSINYLLHQFDDIYKVDNFSFVDDRGDLHQNVELNPELINSNCFCNYGCGIFEMTKRA